MDEIEWKNDARGIFNVSLQALEYQMTERVKIITTGNDDLEWNRYLEENEWEPWVIKKRKLKNNNDFGHERTLKLNLTNGLRDGWLHSWW